MSARSTFDLSLRRLLPSLLALGLAGCPSCGPLQLPCNTSAECPAELRCVEGLCAADPGPASGDDAGAGDAGSADAGSSDAGEPDAGGADGGTGGGVDGGTTDGGPDGGALDAGPDGGVADAGFCDGLRPSPTFCDDFDRGALRPGWDVGTPDNATSTISDAGARSRPFALLLRAPAGVTRPSAELFIEPDAGGPWSRRRVRADLRAERLDPAGLRTVLLTNSVGAEGVFLAAYAGGVELYELRAAAPGQVALPELPLDSWTTVELDLTVGPSTTVTVRYGWADGGVSEVLAAHPVGLSGGPSARAQAKLGLYVEGTTTGETRVSADNFVYELQP